MAHKVSLVLVLQSWYKASNAPFVRSLAVDEERMRSGCRLELVLCVPSSALTLMVGWQEGQAAHEKSHSTNP